MKIEVLFPEAANYFGDVWNHRYLKACMPDAELIETSFADEPAFAKGDVDLIYMGAMTERSQELAIKKLLPYRERIRELIDGGTVFLMTSNAGEVFGRYIENEDGSRVEGLGIFELYAKRDMMHRHNSTVLGKFGDIELVGFKAEFSQLHGLASDVEGLAELSFGTGRNSETKIEGVRIGNFFSTSIVGPFLLLNPLFVKYLMELLGIKDPVLRHEDVIMAAYEKRLADIKRMAGK